MVSAMARFGNRKEAFSPGILKQYRYEFKNFSLNIIMAKPTDIPPRDAKG